MRDPPRLLPRGIFLYASTLREGQVGVILPVDYQRAAPDGDLSRRAGEAVAHAEGEKASQLRAVKAVVKPALSDA